MPNSEFETLDELFESVLLNESDVEDVLDDDMEDMYLDTLEENRKENISIFDSEYLLEGEMTNDYRTYTRISR